MIRSFMKWAGNKFNILDDIFQHMPSGTRIVEPFAGSSVVTLNSPLPSGLVSDINTDLINTFKFLQLSSGNFVNYCKSFFTIENNTPEKFYKLRNLFNNSSDDIFRAAVFVYLNRHCFNGLCRYNSSGGFNVPFGKYKTTKFPEKEIKAFLEKCPHISFKNVSYEDLFLEVKCGDVVYCDPPYIPETDTSFVNYSGKGFTVENHVKLNALARNVADLGANVIISNSDTVLTRNIYIDCDEIKEISVRRFISANGVRKLVKEVFIFYRESNNEKKKQTG